MPCPLTRTARLVGLSCLTVLTLLMAGEPIRSGCEYDYPPFCTVTADGKAEGFSVELLRAALQAMGQEVTFAVGPWSTLKQDLAQGRLQVLPLVARTPEREGVFDFTAPYMTMHGTIAVRSGETGIRSLEDLRGRRVGVLRGDSSEEFAHRVRLDATILASSTYPEAFRRLSAGSLDAVLIQRLVFLQLCSQYRITDLVCTGPIVPGWDQKFCFAVREGDAALLDVLNEGLAIVRADGTYRRLYDASFSSLDLIERGRSRLVVGGDSANPPYEFLDRNGQPAGFAVDLTRAIAKQMGLQVDIRLGPWDKAVADLTAGSIDVLENLTFSAERDRRYGFSPPHDLSPACIVSRVGEAQPADLTALAGRSILVSSGGILADTAKEAGLGQRLEPVASFEEALRRLAAGQADCALVPRLSALYLIRQHGWDNLRLSDGSIRNLEQCYAVHKGNDATLSDFTKGLAALQLSGEYRRIRDQWLAPYEGPGARQVIAYASVIVGLLLAVVLILLAVRCALQRQVARATDQAVEAQERLTFALEASHIGAWDLDLVHHTAFRTLEHDIIFGYEALLPQWTYEMFLNHVIPEDRAQVEATFQKAFQDQGTWNFQCRIVRRDGELRWIWASSQLRKMDEAGRYRRMVGIVQDITDRKQAELRLRANEEDLAITLRSIGDAVIATDAAEKITRMNPVAEALTGWSAAEALGQPLSAVYHLVHAETRAVLEGPFERVMRLVEVTGLPNHTLLIARDGQEYRIADSAAPIQDDQQRVRGMVVVFRDVTARHQLEERLRQSQKQEVIGQLVSGVAHDFNNMLAVIIGAAELIEQHIASQPAVERPLGMLIKSAKRAADLTTNLLNFARMGKVRSVSVDLHHEIGMVVAILQRTIDRNITIVSDLAARNPQVSGDPTQIQNMLLNLCLNARDAMPQGGRLTIATRDVPADDPEAHTLGLPVAAHLALTLSDTGVGIPAWVMARLFEPFVTTKEKGKGTGLGLASVYGAVRDHGGVITVSSPPGKGTTFRILLPSSQVQEDSPTSTPALPGVSLGGRTILVADDEDLVREMLGTQLEDLGAVVVTAVDGQQAVDLFRADPDRFDMVILDQMMPRLDGTSAFRIMHALRPSTRIMITSGFVGEQDLATELEGLAGFLSKPFTRDELLSKVLGTATPPDA